MAKRQVKETKKPELVYGKYPFNAIEVVEFIKDYGCNKKGDKAEKHPNTAKLLRYNGIVK